MIQVPATSVDGENTPDHDRRSFWEWGTVLLRRRHLIIGLAFLLAVLGLTSGLITPRVYKSSVTFLPQGSSEGMNSIALAASQFGVNLPSGNNEWWPAIYVDVLKSRSLLEPITKESFVVKEQGGRSIPFTELFQIKAKSPAQLTEKAVEALRMSISAGEDRATGSVGVSVFSEWPSVSYALANRLVDAVQKFNQETRKGIASAERQFVDAQTEKAARELREAEDNLQYFLQHNRVSGSPQLTFQQDRLQRSVVLKQDIYTMLSRSREDARLREVRNTPVITILERPVVPVVGEARGSVIRALLGGIAGLVLGIIIALGGRQIREVRGSSDEKAREFFEVVEESTPRVLRRFVVPK